MQFIRHRDVNISFDELKRIAAGAPLPEGSNLAIDIGDGFISVSPEDKANITGEHGEGTDYILIADTGDE